jgi:hypothetical protein
METNHTSVENLSETILRLQEERQFMRAEGADSDGLERNRQNLIHLHQELGRALIERHRSKFVEHQAA